MAVQCESRPSLPAILRPVMRFAFSFFMVSVAFAALGMPSAPVGLLVNGVRDPLTIDRDATRFTWMSADTTRGEKQTAYQIVVLAQARSADSGLGTVDSGLIWWDSGKVDSDKSASVEYAGKPLPASDAILVEGANLGPDRQGQPLQCARTILTLD